MINTKYIQDRLRGTDDYTFISSKMGEVCVAHLIESVLEVIPDTDKIVIELGKILVGRQNTDISDDDVSLCRMAIENKRKQDESNYINYLIERNEKEKIRILTILDKYIVKDSPLCEQNVLINLIKEQL
jgi:hypothetical protein